jgi:hypothetical protein
MDIPELCFLHHEWLRETRSLEHWISLRGTFLLESLASLDEIQGAMWNLPWKETRWLYTTANLLVGSRSGTEATYIWAHHIQGAELMLDYRMRSNTPLPRFTAWSAPLKLPLVPNATTE